MGADFGAVFLRALRITNLDDRIRDGAVNGQAFVEAFASELLEVCRRRRRIMLVQLDRNRMESLLLAHPEMHEDDLVGTKEGSAEKRCGGKQKGGTNHEVKGSSQAATCTAGVSAPAGSAMRSSVGEPRLR